MRKYLLPAFLGACFLPGMAMAADEGSQLNGADMAYMAISTLLVLIMTPALAFSTVVWYVVRTPLIPL